MTSLREKQWVAAIAAFAFLRVLAFSAALPFFNGIDEHLHFDVVQKYSRGFLPGPEDATFDAVSVQLLAYHGSFEYLKGPGDYAGGRFPTPDEIRALRPPGSPAYKTLMAWYTSRTNIEAEAPPLYYALAGAWLRLGRALGLEGAQLLYWLRWPGPLLTAAVVVLTWLFLRRRYPDDTFLRLGPCVFLAGWPNDLQYGVTPDVLSIGLGALCFFGLVRLRESPHARLLAVATGLAIGLAFLNKYPNVLYAAVAAALFVPALRAAPRAALVSWSLMAVAAAGPALWWLERNLRLVGSLTGAHRKVEIMGWSYNGLDAIAAHPLVGVRGWFEFVPNLLRTFWQGEFAWHGLPTHTPAIDAMYIATSLLFLGAAALAALRSASGARLPERVALLACAAGVAVLAALSPLFDYGLEEGPLSRAFPYFASGRLIASIAVPFALLYCSGLARVFARAPGAWARRGPWIVLCGVLAIALGWQLTVFRAAFASPWNWFHAS